MAVSLTRLGPLKSIGLDSEREKITMRDNVKLYILMSIFCFTALVLSEVGVNAWPVTSYKELRYEYVNGQNTTGSCGPASLATLFSGFYGEEVSEEEVIEIMKPFFEDEIEDLEEGKQVPEGGVSMLDLKRASNQLGVPARGYDIPKGKLVEVIDILNSPVLLHLDDPDEHFVLAVGSFSSRVLLADPTWGLYLIGEERLFDRWDGLILAFAPGEPSAIKNAGDIVNQVTEIAAVKEISQLLTVEFLW